MTAAPPTSNPAQPAPDAQYYRAVLHELIDTGLDLTRAIRINANAPSTTPAALADLAVAFERLARAIRRTVALARRLDDPAPAPRDFAAAQKRAAARRQILRTVEDAIQRERPHDRDPLKAELDERMDRPELDEDLDHRPLPEITAEILRDLGIAAAHLGARPWKRRTPEDIADLCARAARTPTQAAPAPPQPADPPRILRLIPAAPDPRDALLDSAAFFPTPKRTE